MKSIVVTGATSFIGIALIKKLHIQGYRVIAIIRPGSNRVDLLNRICPDAEIIECEFGNLRKLRNYINKSEIYYDYEAFYHIGWSSNYDNPRYNYDGQMRNVGYTLDAMRVAKELGCNKFLGVGSQAECGLVNRPINSRTADNPITAYAEAKCETYHKCCELSDKLGIGLYWPRLLSAYGPHDRMGTLVMSCIDACIKRKKIELTRAEQIWDFVYVDDVAKALRLIVEKGKPKKKYSIASGVSRPLKEYIKDIADVYEYPELMDGIGKRPYVNDEVMYLVGDVSELKEDTGMVFDSDFRKHLPLPFV